jgi:hypothetical protein
MVTTSIYNDNAMMLTVSYLTIRNDTKKNDWKYMISNAHGGDPVIAKPPVN